MIYSPRPTVHLLLLIGGAVTVAASMAQEGQREWLAGDSHIHSHWSPGYDRHTPPTAIQGRDALYPTPLNAQMARKFGLAWMVTTDHGGAESREVEPDTGLRRAQESRELVPEVLQFYGMEMNMPGMDHHTLIIPRADFEASVCTTSRAALMPTRRGRSTTRAEPKPLGSRRRHTWRRFRACR